MPTLTPLQSSSTPAEYDPADRHDLAVDLTEDDCATTSQLNYVFLGSAVPDDFPGESSLGRPTEGGSGKPGLPEEDGANLGLPLTHRL